MAAFSFPLCAPELCPEFTDGEEIVWNEAMADGVQSYQSEPGMNAFSRLVLWFVGLLPIEWLL